MMKKIEGLFKDANLYLCGIISILFFGVFFSIQYAPDTYFVFTNTSNAVINQFLTGGRLVTAFVAGISLGILKMNDFTIYVLSYLLAIICTITSLYKMSNLLNKDIKNKIICLIIAILIVINPFSLELFVYIEKGIMMLSVLLCILAVEQIDKFFSEKSWKHAIIALLYTMIATCSYQGTVGVFVVISLFYIIKYSKNVKEFLSNNVKVAVIYGIPAILNFIMVKFVTSNSRVDGEIIFTESINKIVQGLKNLMINTYNILPKYMFFVATLVIILFTIYKIIISKHDRKSIKFLKFATIVYILAGTIVATIAPQILQNTDSIWFVARSSYPAASIIGILLLFAFYECDINKKETNVIIIFCILFLIIQLFCFTKFAIDGYIVNYKDKQETQEIINQIELYEKESGNIINKIAIYYDKNITYVHPDIKSSGDINIRGLCSNWASNFIINYYSGKRLKLIDSKKQLQQDFSTKDWTQYNEEQILFENDTIHLCLY